MNSNERVAKVFAGEIPDRVPIGEFAIDFDTIEKIIGIADNAILRISGKFIVAVHDELGAGFK